MTSPANARALKKLEKLFDDVRLSDAQKTRKKSSVAEGPLFETTILEKSVDRNCDVHGGKDVPKTTTRRESLGSAAFPPRRPSSAMGFSLGVRRESMPTLHFGGRKESTATQYHGVRRDSFGLGLPPARSPEPLVHPASFPSMLRRDSLAVSMGNIRRDSLSSRRDSIGSAGRKFSTDSLDQRRGSWDFGRRGSSSSSGGWEETIKENSVNGKVSVALQAELKVFYMHMRCSSKIRTWFEIIHLVISLASSLLSSRLLICAIFLLRKSESTWGIVGLEGGKDDWSLRRVGFTFVIVLRHRYVALYLPVLMFDVKLAGA